jgi:serine/threonine-protein kinase
MDVPRPLAGRYAFTKRLRGTQKTIIWAARDPTGREVVASVVPPPRAAGLRPLIGLSHENLAPLLEVIETPKREEVPGTESLGADAKIVVAEYVIGRSLQQRLDAGPVSVEDAVEWAALAADALAKIHERNGVHGAVSPRAIVVARPSGGTVPVLTHLVVPPSGAYCSPERVTGSGPSASDDTWALVATLYTALTRRAPFQGGSRTDLARAIVAASPAPLDDVDPDLSRIVLAGLARDTAERPASAAAFRDALRDWVNTTGRRSYGDFAPVEALAGVTERPPEVGDLSLVAALAHPDSPESRAPIVVHRFTEDDGAEDPDVAPLAAPEMDPARPGPAAPEKPKLPIGGPPVALTTPPKRREPAPRRSPAKFAGVLVAIAVASAAAGVLLGRLRAGLHPPKPEAIRLEPVRMTTPATEVSRPETGESARPASAPAEAPGASATGATSAAAPASSVPGAGAPVGSASPSPPGDPNACVLATVPPGTMGDAPDVGFLCRDEDLWAVARRMNLYVARHGKGPGMVLWASLGRFDLAALATLFSRCCPGSPPFVAATPKGVCETLTSSLANLGKDPSPPHVDQYASDVECLIARKVRYPTEWWDRVGAKDARTAFDQFVKQLRTP